jgi:OOP family OmpA-OmpF porin
MSNFNVARQGACKTIIQSALIAAFAAVVLAPSIAMAQTPADPNHWHNAQGITWKNPNGLCWRSGSWTPATATAECEPELMAQAPAPAPARVDVAPAPVPAPAPAPAKVETRKLSFSAEELFDFDKAVLKPGGKGSLEKLSGEIKGVNYDTVLVTGHTDRIGRPAYNQKLSERRASAVRAFLISKGIPDNRITSLGKGETQPVTKPGECKGPISKKLIACLQPDRRVDVEVSGTQQVTLPQ